MLEIFEEDRVQVSPNGKTVWVHAKDGSTVGRFSKTFGMDCHTTITEQLAGAGQCLHCTHEVPGPAEWETFCELMHKHYGIAVNQSLLSFESQPTAKAVS
jgi:hypothetical protein